MGTFKQVKQDDHYNRFTDAMSAHKQGDHQGLCDAYEDACIHYTAIIIENSDRPSRMDDVYNLAGCDHELSMLSGSNNDDALLADLEGIDERPNDFKEALDAEDDEALEKQAKKMQEDVESLNHLAYQSSLEYDGLEG